MKFGCTELDINIRTLAGMCGGKLFCKGNPSTSVYGVSTDSRVDCTGECFFAITGENFDGHDFVGEAKENGAVCAVVSKKPDCDIPYILVDDTVKALGALAKAYKSHFRVITIAVTGSVGKTTTKQYIHSILSQKYKTHKTEGNFNSEIGLPLTVLSLEKDDRLLVLEMGMSAAGEISALSKIAEPDIAVITCIGNSHIEKLGSRENICAAKLEIADGMKGGAIVVLDGDEPLLSDVLRKKQLCRIYFGIKNKRSDYLAENIVRSEDGMRFDVKSNIGGDMKSLEIKQIGAHNVKNALAAVTVASLLDISDDEISAGLLAFSPVKLRQSIVSAKGFTVIEDCYNAGPESMSAALDVLDDVAKGRKIAILGEMRELGEYSASLHREVGKKAAALGVDRLVTIGALAGEIANGAKSGGMSPENITEIADWEDAKSAADAIKAIICDGDTVLIKASRALSLERISKLLQE